MLLTQAPSSTYVLRAATLDDLPAVAELVLACDMADFGEPDSSLDDLRDEWSKVEVSRDVWLVSADDGQLAGYGKFWARRPTRLNSDWYVHPNHDLYAVGSQLIEQIERRAAEHLPTVEPGLGVILRCGANAHDERFQTLLRDYGYTLVRYFWRMMADLKTPPAPPVWPDGIVGRPFVLGQDDYAMYTALNESFRDHWGTPSESYEVWRQRNLDKPDADTSRWWIAFNGDEVAAALRGETYLDMGWVGLLGVRRPWRRRGLGNAMLYYAFGEFYRQGFQRVGLAVDAESLTGATRIYERAGMYVNRNFAVYQKVLREGEGLQD